MVPWQLGTQNQWYGTAPSPVPPNTRATVGNFQNMGTTTFPRHLKKCLNGFRSSEWKEKLESPRKPNLTLTPVTNPMFAVSLAFMPQYVKKTRVDILVMIDHGDTLLHLTVLRHLTLIAALNAFFTQWISFFDANNYVVVDHGPKLSAELMKEKLYVVETLMLAVPKKAPWGIGRNERSYLYIHKLSIFYFSKLMKIQAISTKYFLPM